ncbi:MAG: hypothetical protein JRH16_21800 [Deltaproteobacteria bacterium]|nr:hypothetical protein [Deltaproteobacteria bacterium]
MKNGTRIAALLSVLAYLAAATMPCTVSPLEAGSAHAAAVERVPPAATAASTGTERPAASMMAKCPCTCTERPHSGGVPTAPGYALMRPSGDLVPRLLSVVQVRDSDALRNTLAQDIDPIPV